MGLFRDAVAEIGAQPPPDVPAGYSLFRFSDTGAFRALLEGAGLKDVTVTEHPAPHRVPDMDTLWRGGLGSFAVTASAIGCGNAGQNPRRDRAPRAALHDSRWIAAAGGFQDCRGRASIAPNAGFPLARERTE